LFIEIKFADVAQLARATDL